MVNTGLLTVETVARVMWVARPSWSLSVEAFVSSENGAVAYGASVHTPEGSFFAGNDDECASLADALQLAYGRALHAVRVAA